MYGFVSSIDAPRFIRQTGSPSTELFSESPQKSEQMAGMAKLRAASIDGKLSQEFAVPPHVDDVTELMSAFAERHGSAGRRVVLVTSGGTKVPLESRTVRFLDNFSSGRRGSSSAERFLDRGYAVIFLYRRRSLYPYVRLYSGVNLLDSLQQGSGAEDQVVVNQEKLLGIDKVLKRYQQVKNEGLLLPVEFSTLSEYLHLLRASAQVLGTLGPKAMFYLAAAVSDFYIPASDMPEHKIQSSNGPFQVSLVMIQPQRGTSPIYIKLCIHLYKRNPVVFLNDRASRPHFSMRRESSAFL